MFDNNDYINSLFGDLSSSATTTEQQTDEQSTYSSQTGFSPFASSFERDDYSSTQNFTEQQSYNSGSSNFLGDIQETKKVASMHTPMIEKSATPVNLVKSQQKIRLETRMKIVLSVFSVIVACLLFVTVFNFIKANRLESQFASKQLQINQLQQDILNQKATYTWIENDLDLKEWADSNGFYEKDHTNTMVIELDEMYLESTTDELPTNWFDSLCEFFSKLIA